MKSRLVAVVLVCLFAVAGAHAVLAQTLFIPPVYYGISPVSITICPNGDGDALEAAWLYGTNNTATNKPFHVDATITARMGTAADPIPNYPFEDVWLEFVFTGSQGCVGGPVTLVADADSDANGMVAFSRPLYGCGCSTSVTINFYVDGVLVTSDATTNMRMNTVDFTGDLYVDGTTGLPDAVTMAPLHAAKDYCADLDHNAKWTTNDNSVLGRHTFVYLPLPPWHICP